MLVRKTAVAATAESLAVNGDPLELPRLGGHLGARVELGLLPEVAAIRVGVRLGNRGIRRQITR